MKRVVSIALCTAIIAALCGCKSAPPPAPPPPPDYQKQAIQLHLQADPRLNLYQNSPHTLLVCVYQLRDPNAFNQLVDQRDGLPKLMECDRFDGSVAYAKRMVVQPSQDVREPLDRAEGARYLGVVAGYFTTQKEHPSRLYRIPASLGDKAGPMKVDLYLGPQSIEGGGGK